MQLYRSHVLVCGGTGCTSSNSEKIISEFNVQLANNNLQNEVKIVKTGCFGLCAQGPIVVVYPEGAMYTMVKVEDIKEITEEHLLKGRIVKRLLHNETHDEGEAKSLDGVEFFKRQMRIALRNCGIINPENIDEYIAYDGYKALAKVLTELKPTDVVDTLKNQDFVEEGAEDSQPDLNGNLLQNSLKDRNMYAVMLTKEIQVRSWTEVFLKGTHTPLLKQWL